MGKSAMAEVEAGFGARAESRLLTLLESDGASSIDIARDDRDSAYSCPCPEKDLDVLVGEGESIVVV